MTLSDATAYIRSLIKESTAKFWTDVEITLYLKVAYSIVLGNFYYLLYPLYKKTTLRDKTANSDTFALPADYYKMGRISVASTGRNLHYIEDDEYWKVADWEVDDAYFWMWSGGAVKLIPTPGSTEVGYFRIWYLPTFATITDFPEVLHPLICAEAIISAKIKDEDLNADILNLRKVYSDTAVADLTTLQFGDPTVMGDYELDQGYC